LEFAHARGAVVIEDDYDSEFRFGGRPLDALQTLDRAESVFYVGTFSKSLFPALRLGFAVAPPWAHRALGEAKRYADSHSAPLTQETLAAFISGGHLARHVRRMRRIYGARREVLLNGLRADFSRWLEPVPSVAGLHLAALAKEGVDIQWVAENALGREVGVRSVDRFRAGRAAGADGLVFGYGALDEEGIVAALGRLRRVFGK
jgi:GntR family transcriptional regulator/MocR family aminotransferase